MIQVAIVGFGYSAVTFHIPFILASARYQLVAICSSRPDEVRRCHPEVECYLDCQSMLASCSAELVIITTPNEQHFPIAKACVQQDKHVVVEKPFVTSVQDGEALIRLAAHHKRVLSVFHNRRWDGDFITLRALIDEHAVGKVKYFESHFDRFRPQVRQRWRELPGQGSGIWFDLGPHLLDQAVQLFGMPDAITANIRALREHSQSSDFFHILLHYADKQVVLHSSPYCAGETLRFQLQGDRGSYEKLGLDPQEAALKNGVKPTDNEWSVSIAERAGKLYREGEAVITPTQPGRYMAYFDMLARSIEDDGPVPVSAQEALDVMRLIEAGQLSSDSEQRVTIGINRPSSQL